MYSLPTNRLLLLRCLILCAALHFGSSYTLAAASEHPGFLSVPAAISVIEDGKQISVSTFKQEINIHLEQNKLLGDFSELQRAIHQLPLFYSGTVDGDPSSWVRLSQNPPEQQDDSAQYFGHIFTAGSLYKLHYHEGMESQALSMIDKPDFDTVALTALSARSAGSKNSAKGLQASRAISIGIIIDSHFNERHNGRGLARALSIINGVDGLYQSQLGLAVEVESFRLYDEPASDPMRDFAGTMEQALESYREIRLNDEELPKELALTHVFSGFSDPQSTIGLGWIGTACRLDGYDMSISTPFPYDMLLAAHEIAHNLGAPHDDDRQCNSDPSISGAEVMWSELSGSTRATFSACSLDNMRATLEAACVSDNINVAIALKAEPSDNSDQQTLTITVQNNDLNSTAAAVESVTQFPTGTTLSAATAACSIDTATLICQHLNVKPNQPSIAAVTLTLPGMHNSTISSELQISGFIDTAREDNRAALQLDADRASFSYAVAGADEQYEPTATNAAADDASPTTANAAVKVGSFGPLGLIAVAMCGFIRRKTITPCGTDSDYS